MAIHPGIKIKGPIETEFLTALSKKVRAVNKDITTHIDITGDNAVLWVEYNGIIFGSCKLDTKEAVIKYLQELMSKDSYLRACLNLDSKLLIKDPHGDNLYTWFNALPEYQGD